MQLRRALLGDEPKVLLYLTAPTLLALAIDLGVRGGALIHYAPHGYGFYVGSLLLSLAFWVFPLHLAARLLVAARGRRPAPARAGLALLFALWFLPLSVFCYGGQLLYRRVFDAYMGRNSLRLGIAFRGTVHDWFAAWSGPWLLAGVTATGVVITCGLAALVRRTAASRPARTPLLPAFTFIAAIGCFWFDLCDSRYLQAATPDACFVHGVVHVARVVLTGKWHVRQGVSLRTPAPLPPLASERERRPNVLVILGESVRADTLCSKPPPACASPELDAVAGERIPLGKLTTPTPNTFSACVLLWTGLEANTPFASAHTAPVLWELARAAGYRTAYITSQNPNYEDFGVFTRGSGIDVLETATDLGGMSEEQIGAPDERAIAAMLRFVRESPGAAPWFGLLQLSNTHQPYRVDPDLQPCTPHSGEPTGDAGQFRNHYRNSVRLLERMLAGFLAELRAAPGWDSTVVVFLSDHGEQFRDHGGLYHNHSLYEEELRIPGFLLAGAGALDAGQRRALGTWADQRTYTQDVHQTVVDLLGLEGARASLPLASQVVGRSLLRPRNPLHEPATLLATSTAVWEPTDARFGVMSGERVLWGAAGAPWMCFELDRDPGERSPLPPERCGALPALALAREGRAAVSAPGSPVLEVMASPPLHHVQANGLRFAYFEEGRGPLVLLLHGFPDTPRTWDVARPALAAAGFRVVTPFARGYAPSEIPGEEAYDSDTLGRDAIALIEALGEEKAFLVGHDWGASAAYSAAGLAPERLRMLITLAIPHPAAVLPTPSIVWGLRHFFVLSRPGAAAKIRAEDFATIDMLVRRWSPGWDVPPGETDAVKAALREPGSLEAALGYYRAALRLSLPAGQRQKVRVPAAAFAGETDVVPPSAYERARSRYADRYEVVRVPGGHFMHREHPETFARELVRVIEGGR